MKLAARNLWRNRRRTILTFSALSFGIVCLIIVDSLMQGMTRMGERNIITLETGEIQIHAPGYFAERDKLPLDLTLDAADVLAVLDTVDEVRWAAPRIVTGARLNVGWEEFPVLAVAVDPELDSRALDVTGYIVGRFPAAGALEAAVGSGLADLLAIAVDDYITVIVRTRSGAIEALDFVVTGILNTPNPVVNQNHVYLPLDVADAAFGMNGQVTTVVTRLWPGVALSEGAEAIRRALSDAGVAAEVFTWRETQADFIALTQASNAADMMFIGIILVIALVGVTNTILLGTMERTREIGTMHALGMRHGEIVRLFLLEATGIAVLAVISGMVVGLLCNWYFVVEGVDLAAFIGDMDLGFAVQSVVYGVWNVPLYVWTAVIAVITCWLAAYFPARRAARMDPAAAMRE